MNGDLKPNVEVLAILRKCYIETATMHLLAYANKHANKRDYNSIKLLEVITHST